MNTKNSCLNCGKEVNKLYGKRLFLCKHCYNKTLENKMPYIVTNNPQCMVAKFQLNMTVDFYEALIKKLNTKYPERKKIGFTGLSKYVRYLISKDLKVNE